MTNDPIHLSAQDPEGLRTYLLAQGWASPSDEIGPVTVAGAGNMNLTLRVAIGVQSFVLKQSRPWVEKYPSIPAPVERSDIEAAFYRCAHTSADVSKSMPDIRAFDPHNKVLLMEDLGPGGDCTSLYAGLDLASAELASLVAYLGALHRVTPPEADQTLLRNRAMRKLNHQHIFDIPLHFEGGVDLDSTTEGLADVAKEVRTDTDLRAKITKLGALYLADGDTLLHGDFYPGSWLRRDGFLYVIDPEFCFLGPPEFDLGIMYGHLLIAGGDRALWQAMRQEYPAPCDDAVARAFAGVEIIRRLLGVAQLPLNADLARKSALLDRARNLVLDVRV